MFSFLSSVRFILSKRHFFTIHSNPHVIQINLQTKSIILYRKLLFSGVFVISHKISTQNVFVTEFKELTQFKKAFAVFCNHCVFSKNCSGLSNIFTIKDVVLGLLTTWIFQIFSNIISSSDFSHDDKLLLSFMEIPNSKF
jgi:hypothetical protein